ncbi:MAG: SDR family NAD(P)-dependent oxidoreductase [Halobacteriota archaeon]
MCPTYILLSSSSELVYQGRHNTTERRHDKRSRTGCRGGIGLDVACRLLKRGHMVYATVHREESINGVRIALQSCNEIFVADKLDVTDAHDIEKVDNWDIDVLINNAALGDFGPLAEIGLERIKATCETNVFSTLRLTQRVVPKLIAKAKGGLYLWGQWQGLLPRPFTRLMG